MGHPRRGVAGHPAVAGPPIDCKRHVPHAQPGMPALLDVPLGSAEPADDEIAQTLLGAGQIVRRVHRSQHIVGRHLRVKGADETLESFFADARIDTVFCHNSSMSDDAPKSALELAMERLKKKDAAEGIAELTLSDEQRQEIAEIRRVYSAKIAQEEILHRSKAQTTWDPEERAKMDEGHRREVQRLNEERDRKIDNVRSTKP